MADIADITQQRIDKENEQRFQGRPLVPQENNDDQPYDCIDCDEHIPQARVHLGFKKRCVHCQNEYEKQCRREVR